MPILIPIAMVDPMFRPTVDSIHMVNPMPMVNIYTHS